MAKVTVDNLAETIQGMLEEYEGEVETNLSAITKKIGQTGVKALKSSSSSTFGGSGKYARGWKSKTEVGRLNTVTVLYNSSPGLPHLLENGHAKRGGGRVPGRAHIKPVETELINIFEEEVKAKL